MAITHEPTRLILLTFDAPHTPPDADACSGGYVCDCRECSEELERRLRRGIKPRGRQPWEDAA